MKEGFDMLRKVRSEDVVLSYVLRDLEVIMSDAMIDALSFPTAHCRYRRDHAVFIDMIVMVAYMRQYEKAVQTHRYEDGEEIRYVLCDGRDYEIAYGLFCDYMRNDPEYTSYEDLEQVTKPEGMWKRLEKANSNTKSS